MHSSVRHFVRTLFILGLGACGDAAAPTPDPIIEIVPNELTLRVGESRTLSAVVQNSDAAPAYSSLNNAVAVVTPDGTVTGIAPGNTSIAVTVGRVTAHAPVTVRGQGSLETTVQDQFGGPLSGARVEIRENGSVVATGNTSANGTYTRTALDAGDYTVRVSKNGFVTNNGTTTVPSGATGRVTVRLQPESMPSAAVLSVQSRGRSGTNYFFDLDLLVVDANAQPLTLPASAYTIAPFTSSTSGASYSFTQTAFTPRAGTSNGPFSAALLLDQSGSISSTDPNHSRLQAAKIFLNALGPGETAALSAFASGGAIPFELTLYNSGNFSSTGSMFFSALDALASQVSGGTPLYRSIYNMIDHTATRAPTQNKAVIVFTDGDDTGGGVTINQIAARATQTGVKVYTVALGQVNAGVLSDIAIRSGGSFMWAGDARQLVSVYGTLGNILRGNVNAVRTSWTINSTSSNTASITTSVRIATPSGTISAPFKVNF